MILRISSKSNPNSIAGAIAGSIKEENMKEVELQAVGAGAVNQAVKAAAIARGFLTPSGIDIVCIPSFREIDIEGMNRTCIKIVIRTV